MGLGAPLSFLYRLRVPAFPVDKNQGTFPASGRFWRASEKKAGPDCNDAAGAGDQGPAASNLSARQRPTA